MSWLSYVKWLLGSQTPSPIPEEGTYLFVDVFPGDVDGKPDWKKLAAHRDAKFHYVGGIIKASDGVAWGAKNEAWFRKNWDALETVAPERFGDSWFRGAYHFLELCGDGRAQADYYLRMTGDAMHGDNGTLLPIVDVELGGERHANRHATRRQIIDCVSLWCERVKSVTGRKVILYGRGAQRDLGIASKMGADLAWNPAYTKRILPMTPYGFTDDEVPLWQYCGDGYSVLPGFPATSPIGKVDVSVYIDGPRATTLDSLRDRIL